MLPDRYSDKSLSLALALSAAAWGLYWYPLRTIEAAGLTGSWSVVYFNACPLILLCPIMAFRFRTLIGIFWPTIFAALMIGLAFTMYANGLIETTVIRATMLYYLTPVWSTIIGVAWLSEPLTRARLVAIAVAFAGLFLLLSNGEASNYPLNIGDLYSLLSGIFWAVGVATLNRWSSIPILPLAAFIFLSTTAISAFFAGVLYVDPLPSLSMMQPVFTTALFWSTAILLPCFCIIFRVSQLLFPGRVGILTMSEVVVAIVSASILIPEETMEMTQWLGALAIIVAGLIEVLLGYSRKPAKELQVSIQNE